MTDIVDRLAAAADSNRYTPIGVLWNLCDEAAAEIERLRATIRFDDEMREQLLHDAANLRDYASCTEPAGSARVMVEVAEHLEELCGKAEDEG